jgi:hypothetical protein
MNLSNKKLTLKHPMWLLLGKRKCNAALWQSLTAPLGGTYTERKFLSIPLTGFNMPFDDKYADPDKRSQTHIPSTTHRQDLVSRPAQHPALSSKSRSPLNVESLHQMWPDLRNIMLLDLDTVTPSGHLSFQCSNKVTDIQVP